ncbi:MAG: hypothetical protein PHG67_13070 [Bacteroidales bacterium]|nr:hypothetical protein [Bacteroidales bacterium]
MKITTIWFKIFLVFGVVLFVSACSPTRKLAKSYINESTEWNLLVLFPDQLFKVNDRYDRDESKLTGLSEAAKHDSLLAQSLFLSSLNDSTILFHFKNAYWDALSRYDVKLFSEADFDRFYEQDSLSWIINVAQIELQEFISDTEDEENFFGLRYTQIVPLNGINFAVWTEINALNDKSSENKVYFTDQNLFDYHEGQFTYDFFTGSVNYYYHVDTLNIADIENFASFMGRLSATYTYDQLLNNKLKNYTRDEDHPDYYRYDPYSKRLFKTEFDRFIELEE